MSVCATDVVAISSSYSHGASYLIGRDSISSVEMMMRVTQIAISVNDALRAAN